MEARSGGRQMQRERTRRAIVAAAAKMVSEGALPSIAEVAEEALVSTATAYRYYPDQLSLLNAALHDGVAGIGDRFKPDIGEESDPVRRVDLAAEGLLQRIINRETLVRAVMALSLLRTVDSTTPHDDAVGLRPGFRRAWIDEALLPVEKELDPEKLRLLKLALGAIMGSEALFALEDVLGIESKEAIDVCRWMARTLTEAMLSSNSVKRERN